MMHLIEWNDVINISIVKAIRSLFLVLCDFVYRLIIVFFDIFSRLGSAEILQNSTIQAIYSRIGLIIGIFMVFRISFSFIQYLINPDTMLDKQKGMGEIVKRVIIVIVLLGITPTLFREAFTLQNYLVKQNVIGKIFSNDSNINSDDVGRNLAWYGFSSFFTINPDAGDAASKCSEVTDGNMEYDFKQNGSLISAYKCVNMESDGNTLLDFLSPINSLINNRNRTFVIDFEANGLVPFLVGVLILWVIIVYTIQLGVRLLQLAYLQLVAPIPIMMYLEPKKNDTLGKWANQCLVTFLDFFIRIAIMYFAIFIIDLIIKNGSSSVFMATFGNSNLATKLYINIIMIIAVLIFVKRVPNLLKEVFPALNSAATLDFGLKPPKEAVQVTKAITGAATAGAIGLIGGGPGLANKLMGFAGGALKGGYGGFNGDKLKDIASARAKQNITNRQNRLEGNTFGVRMGAKLRDTFGFDSEGYTDVAKMQHQWDDGRETAFQMSANNISNLNANTSDNDFKKLGFNQEWVDAFRNRSRAKSNLESADAALREAQQSGVGIAEALKAYNDAQASYDTANKIKTAMDKKYAEDAQKFSNYKFYTSNSARPGSTVTSSSPSPQSSSTISQYQGDGRGIPITPSNSMFANMSDEEWMERQVENTRDAYATKSDPNEYFEKMYQKYADDYLENNGVSDEFDKTWESHKSAMEEAYKKTGWTKNSNGDWINNNENN